MGGTPTAMRDSLDPTGKVQSLKKDELPEKKLKKKSINDLEPELELELELPHLSLLTIRVST
jgi:hypothetical protein